MKKIGNALFLILLSFVLCTLTGRAATPEGSLTVILEDGDEAPIDGLTVHVSKIADGNGTAYEPATGFQGSGLSIAGIVNDPSAANAADLHRFVKEKGVPALSAVSASGRAAFAGLDAGIWLVYGDEEATHSFNPYIVFLPYVVNGEWQYAVSSAPKTEVNAADDKSVYVVKRWDDKNDAAKKRPKDITVELRRDGAVIGTAILNEGNGWAHTFSRLPDTGVYEVAEKTVKAYSPTYSGDSENGFIITNTYNGEKLPQTGQLWWPVVILSVAGVLFVLLGILELGARQNGKKNK